ncbi:regulator of nonsense-mediated decay, partial [Dipodascopsis uninucleata]
KEEKQQESELRTKVVIRHLPPLTEEEDFVNLVGDEFLGIDNVEGLYFVKGKIHKSRSTPTTYGRAYVRFKSVETLIKFRRKFSGMSLKDSKDNESTIQIEFAPYQKFA